MADFVDTGESVGAAFSIVVAECHPIDVLKLALTINANLSRHAVTGRRGTALKPALILLFVAHKINEAVVIGFANGTKSFETAIVFFLENR